MRIPRRSFLSLPIIFLATGTLWAADDPFVGKWTVNKSKTKLTDEMTVEAVGENKYAITFGKDAVDTIVADGTDQAALRGTTLSVTVEGPNNWKIVRKKDGRPQVTGNWTLSADGKTLDDDYTSYDGDRPTTKLHYVYQRAAGSSGFIGTWDTVSGDLGSIPDLEIQPYEGDGLSFGRFGMRMKFDGKDYPFAGKVLVGYSSSGRRIDGRSIETTDKFQGKIIETRKIELSNDLKTVTMSVFEAGESKAQTILVFDREE